MTILFIGAREIHYVDQLIATDKSWTRSMDATDRAQNSRVDIFAREDKKRVSSMLNRHLQWWRGGI